jgi:hypothetical protein
LPNYNLFSADATSVTFVGIASLERHPNGAESKFVATRFAQICYCDCIMLSYKLDKENMILITTWVGEVRDAVLIEFYEKIRADPSFDHKFREIVDLRQADLSGVTAEGLQRLNELHTDHMSKFKEVKPTKAAIIASEALSYGLSRMYSGKSDEMIETNVFKISGEALAWLELPDDYQYISD